MKKLVRLPILLFFALAMFFACTKDTSTPTADTPNQSSILSMTKDKDGILNLTVEVGPTVNGAVKDRDGCTLYEALRFRQKCSDNEPSSSTAPFTVTYVKFRLIIINKQTEAKTPVSDWIIVDNGNGVSGLNISWYNQSPRSDYWYATEFEDCGPSGSGLCTTNFYICDFWSDDAYLHLDTWNCDPQYADAAGYATGELVDAYVYIARCTLGLECTVTGDEPPFHCDD
ncbi:MAG: hypothetical protein KIS77_18390 [Saprospiraceae bacterium]|nr:hypothetical protein [Saprospiraceae bacterium]